MFYLGIDVSKAKLHACLLLDELGKTKSKTVEDTPSGITTLLAWAARQDAAPDQLHGVMEATGVYQETAAQALFDAGAAVSIVNPAQTKDFARSLAVRTKTDGMDGCVLARFGSLLKPVAWQPPSPEVRTLQSLLARREALAQDRRREHNRQEKALATTTPERILQSIKDTLACLDQELAKLQQDINDHIHRHPHLKDELALLTSIPAVGPASRHSSAGHPAKPCLPVGRTAGGLCGMGTRGTPIRHLCPGASPFIQGRSPPGFVPSCLWRQW